MRRDTRSNVGLPREAPFRSGSELHVGNSTRVQGDDLLPFDGQQNKNGPRHLYLAAEMSEGLADREGVDYE